MFAVQYNVSVLKRYPKEIIYLLTEPSSFNP